MKKTIFILSLGVSILFFSFKINDDTSDLRKIYSQPSSKWPKPFIDENIKWQELGILPPSPLESRKDSLKHLIELGKILFFDPRLSGSGKISCASCHDPALSWTDGKEKSTGHEGALTKRNSPTIQNVWFYEKLFWDGRAKDLQDQAFAPINSESEMHNEMHLLMRSVNKSKAYKELFRKAFGDDDINPDRLTEAIAVFEKTIVSNKSRFDYFLEGNKNALTGSELRGLHLFRTKARCMNCHHGSLFTDNKFHNNGFADGDKGLYIVSHLDEDIGKIKTPSLRDVMKTKPWMHNGEFDKMENIIEKYNDVDKTTSIDPHIKSLKLTGKEKKDLIAFLNSISADPLPIIKPIIP